MCCALINLTVFADTRSRGDYQGSQGVSSAREEQSKVIYIQILKNRLINAIIAEDNKVWSASNDFILIHDAEVRLSTSTPVNRLSDSDR